MAVDETSARLDRLEAQLRETNESIRAALANGSKPQIREAERDIRRVEDDFTDEERRMVREHREWSSFERMMSRWEEQKAKAKAEAEADEDDDDPEAKPKPKATTKAKAKPKPASRHPEPDEDAPEPEQKPEPEKKPHWLLRD